MIASKTLLAALALILATGVSGVRRDAQSGEGTSSASSIHSDRGERVRQSYLHYADRLEAYQTLLSRAFIGETQVERKLLEHAAPLAQGYQILPKIIPDVTGSAPPLLRSSQYSWPATEKLIDEAMAEMARAEKALKKAAGSEFGGGSYEQLARTYRRLRERQENVEALIRHNRLWQADILARRASYDRWTALHDTVLERQKIRARLALFESERVKKALAILGPFSQGLADLQNRLVKREKILDAMIAAAAGELQVPAFVRLERRPGTWLIHVPFYTDIDNRDFVSSVKKEVENIWRLRHGADEFHVVLTDRYIPASRLYPNPAPPATGGSIDIQGHLARFPLDGAILTTGAFTTHVDGRAVILGPQEISPGVLAHEFGHILGFKDNYFRGYRDLGEDGFEVLEVIADHNDIMGWPSSRAVRHEQFMRLIRATQYEASEPAAY